MPYNLLLLPLLGGYIFVSKFGRLRYYTLRVDGYRLLMHSAVAGAILLLLASVLAELVIGKPWAIRASQSWLRVVPYAYSGRAAIAFLLGAVGWIPLNLVPAWRREHQVPLVIQDKDDPLEMLLRRALGQARLILLTLRGSKVYVGHVQRLFNPAFPLEHIALVPIKSGYRRAEDRRVVFTTYYGAVLRQLRQDMRKMEEELKKSQPSLTEREIRKKVAASELGRRADFELIIPCSEIETASFYDEAIEEAYFKQAASAPAKPLAFLQELWKSLTQRPVEGEAEAPPPAPPQR